MTGVELDSNNFHKRARILTSAFKVPTHKANNKNARKSDFNSADFLLVPVGSADEDENPYSKGTSLQIWLLGYEFPDTVMAVTENGFVFMTSAKKGSILESLVDAKGVPIQIIKRSKDAEENAKLYPEFFSLLSKSFDGKKMGVLAKENPSGKFITEFNSKKSSLGKEFENVDITSGIASVLVVKDEEEIKIVKHSAKLSSVLLNDIFVEEMQNVIDSGTAISHEKMSSMLENKLLSEKERAKLKLPADLVLDLTDWSYTPIIQSGGKYDLKPSAISNGDKLHAGTILCSLGGRYKSYCTNISRTYLVDPEKEKEENYKILLELQDYILSILKPNVLFSEVYAKAIGFIEKRKPELKDHFVKNMGFCTGLEFRESMYVIGPKCSLPIKSGMVLNLSMGFSNLEISSQKDPKKKIYSLLLGDTIYITQDGFVELTQSDKDLKDISYAMGDDSEESSDQENIKAEKRKEKNSKAPVSSKRTAVLDSRRRDETDKANEAEKLKLHQEALHKAKQEEGLSRFASGNEDAAPTEKAQFKKFESYRKDVQIPSRVMDLKIVVDRKAETVLLPIYGQAIPFHVSTIKNVTKSDEQEYTLIRFNFVTPGVTVNKKDNSVFENPSANFIRALSFKSAEVYRMNEVCKEINELKKDYQKREVERMQMADLIEQDDLIEIKGRRPLRLPEVYARPAMDGKRRPGDLEIHQNGLRYLSQLKGDQKIDIAFSNIKHLFFQPCDGEMIVLLHVHLKNPIMIGKKKTKEVQFYREVSDNNFEETGNRRRRVNYGDEEELAAEQEERRRRALLNKEFQIFSEKISEMSKGKCDVDVPFRDLGFQGVPHRQQTLLQPTTDCLVQLTELPFLVITLSDVEIVHLERINFGLKNFDIVFVFKDFKQPVVHVNSVPVDQLEAVKEWLDSVDICFTEGPVNLSWPQIMKTVNDDPAAFFNEGGWSFLLPTGGEGEEEEEEEISEFEMESSEVARSESESDVSSMGTISDSDDYSGSGSGSGEEESEGEDWDELERKAAEKDAKKGRSADYSDEQRPKKFKR